MSHDIQHDARQERIILALYSLFNAPNLDIITHINNERDISILDSTSYFVQKMYIEIKSV
jgi:hypothetical protein